MEASVESLCHGVLREYLARQGFAKTLNAFDLESPRDESSITNRKQLAQSLHIAKLITKNKERGELYKTFLEMIVDYLVARYTQAEAVKDQVPKASAQSSVQQDQPIVRTRKSNSSSNLASDVSVSNLDYHDEDKRRSGNNRSPRSADVAAPDEAASALSRGPSKSSLRTSSSSLGDVAPADPQSSRDKRNGFSADAPKHRSLSSANLGEDATSSPSLRSDKRVGFSMDSPKAPAKSLSSSADTVTDLGMSSLRLSDGKRVGISAESTKALRSSLSASMGDGDDIVSRHARMHSGNGTTKPKVELNGAKSQPESEGNGATNPSAPPNGEPLETFASVPDLDKLVFGPSWRGPKMFQEEWHQGFFFNDCTDLKYGLVQLAGGSCGVLAVVQAYLLKELIFTSGFQKYGFNPSENVRTTALVHALSEILWQVGGSKSVKLVLPATVPKRFKPYKLADWTVLVLNSVTDLQNAIRANLGAFTERNGCGVLLFMYSAILTRGIENVRSDMDVPETALLAPHKYCSQELVNLLLVGKAYANVFDGTMDVGGSTLKGIPNRATVGFLTLMEKMGYCQVGNNFKNPVYPIWIIYSESHYSLLFGAKPPTAPQFDVYYYDQLGNQDEQYMITVDITSNAKVEVSDDELVSPIEMCVLTKWPNAKFDWNGSEPLL